jgi:DNA ligase D-like protein (predicted 3'-phosphoesterase)
MDKNIIATSCLHPLPAEWDKLRFAIQEHYAKSHHFDFRLEKNGVYKSWAVPKGLPDEPNVKRLAVQVDDHELSFGSFEGVIPDGKYGAGKIEVWDNGFYELHSWNENSIAFTLHGRRTHGDFQLNRFTHGRPNDWLIFKTRSHQP